MTKTPTRLSVTSEPSVEGRVQELSKSWLCNICTLPYVMESFHTTKSFDKVAKISQVSPSSFLTWVSVTGLCASVKRSHGRNSTNTNKQIDCKVSTFFLHTKSYRKLKLFCMLKGPCHRNIFFHISKISQYHIYKHCSQGEKLVDALLQF